MIITNTTINIPFTVNKIVISYFMQQVNTYKFFGRLYVLALLYIVLPNILDGLITINIILIRSSNDKDNR